MNIHELDAIEKDSILRFIEKATEGNRLQDKQLLDYGCGKQPYKAVIENAGAYYTPFDRAEFGGGSGGDIGDPFVLSHEWDAILCAQVVQYVPNVYRLLRNFRDRLRPDGILILTYPTMWPEIRDDLHRFTKLGMSRLLAAAAFTVETHEMRASLPFDGFELALGYGVIAIAG